MTSPFDIEEMMFDAIREHLDSKHLDEDFDETDMCLSDFYDVEDFIGE